MTTLLAASTATSSTATEGDVKAFLTNLRTFIADIIGTDSANRAAVQSLLGNVLNGKLSKSAAYTVVEADRGKVIDCTGTWTLSLTAAATLGDGFCFAVRNSGSGSITIDPNLSETVNGLVTYVIGGGDFVIVYCDGAGFSTVGGAAAPVGTVMPTAASSAPAGWLLCYGQSLSVSSYASLFGAIGYTYGGSGANFNLPDLRGRVVAGKDDMGGSSASRLSSMSGNTLGAAGGAQTHTLTAAQMPSHSHAEYTGNGDSLGSVISSTGLGSSPTSTGFSTGSAGSDQAHNNVQPTLILNYMIKT